jgi:glycosyltransferase involved in cell wall biosynthesis
VTPVDRGRGPVNVSIVLEWENAREHDRRRAAVSLRAIASQIAALHPATIVCELIIAFDGDTVDGAELEHAVAPHLGDLLRPEALVLLPCPGASYYALKNAGAARATGDVVVFADSDATPEAGWLERILEPFEDPPVQVACGNTYLAHDTTYSKALALFWLFPLRMEDGARRPTERFFANNIAIRRDLVARHGFPATPRFKGSCAELASRLLDQGITIWLVPTARVAHLPPDAGWMFLRRALLHGHDYWSTENPAPANGWAGLKQAYWRFRAEARWARSRILADGPRVGLARSQVPAAFGIALAYFATAMLGEAVCSWRPDLVLRFARRKQG